MPGPTPGNSTTQGIRPWSTGGALREHQLQLAEHQVPVLAAGVPVLHTLLRGQIQHPAQGIVISKRRLVLCNLPELTVQALDDVRRVYDFTNLQRIFKKRTQDFPIVLPAFDAGGILLAPALTESQQVALRLIQRNCRTVFFRSAMTCLMSL